MTVGVTRPLDILNQTIDLRPKERLGYDQTAKVFVIVRSGVRPSKHINSSLQAISKKIQAMIAQKGLQPEQILNFKLNLSIINTFYHRYNATLARNCFLNFLDKLILIITFGQTRLKFSAISHSQLDNEAKLLISSSSLDYDLTRRLIKYFASDLQRVSFLPDIVPAILETHYKLNDDETAQLVSIADSFAKFLKQNPNRISDVSRKIFAMMFAFAIHPSYAAAAASIADFAFQCVAKFNFQPNFQYMDECGKEMLLDLAVIISKRDAGKIHEVFKSPSNLIMALEYTQNLPNRKELALAMIAPALNQFDSLSIAEKSFLVSYINIQLKSPSNFQLNLTILTAKARASLLAYLTASKDNRVRVSPLSRAMYQACTANCDSLEQAERPHYFALLHLYDATFQALAKSKSLLMDLIKTLTTNGNPHKYDVKRINSYVHEPDLNDDERAVHLKFLAAFDLFSSLSPFRAEHYVVFLAEHPNRIPELTIPAVQLCIKLYDGKAALTLPVRDKIIAIGKQIDINALNLEQLKMFIASSWFNTCTKEQLLKVDFSKISDDKFKLLSNLPCFKDKADIYLTHASDAHLTAYYGASEKSICLNQSHIFAPCSFKEGSIKPLPAGVHPPDLDELATLFDSINFTDRRKSDYCDSPLVDDYNQVVTPWHVRSGLTTLINRIKSRQHYTAVPKPTLSSGSPNPEFIAFFNTITLALQHIILELRRASPAERSLVLVILGIGGHHCGMRHREDAYQMYSLLTLEALGIDEKASAVDIILSLLMQLRLRLIVDEGENFNSDVHHVYAAKKYIGPVLGIKDVANQDDPYEPLEWQPRHRKNTVDKLLRKISIKYVPTTIINALNKFINNKVRTQKLDFRNKFIDAISCKLKTGDPDLGDLIVYGDPDYPGFRITRSGLIFLLKSYGVFADQTSQTKASTLPRPPLVLPSPPSSSWSFNSILRFFGLNQ